MRFETLFVVGLVVVGVVVTVAVLVYENSTSVSFDSATVSHSSTSNSTSVSLRHALREANDIIRQAQRNLEEAKRVVSVYTVQIYLRQWVQREEAKHNFDFAYLPPRSRKFYLGMTLEEQVGFWCLSPYEREECLRRCSYDYIHEHSPFFDTRSERWKYLPPVRFVISCIRGR